MTRHVNSALVEASATYITRHTQLIVDARIAERSSRPLLARRIRRYAEMVANAALAEEIDETPPGLRQFRDHGAERG